MRIKTQQLHQQIRLAHTGVGARIVEELRGISCLPLERCCPPAHVSMSCAKSFGELVTSSAELQQAVTAYLTKAARRLRRARLAAGVVTVFISTNRFSREPQHSNSVTYELADATDSTEELLAWTHKGLEQLYRPGYRYKKAGVLLRHLTPADHLPRRLFGDARFEQARRLMQAVDEINRRFGRDTVRFGTARPGGRWEMKCLRRSPRYTTCFNEVLKVQAC